MQEEIAEYEALGFHEIKIETGIGSRVLVNERKRRAVKFSQAPAYDQFVDVARGSKLTCFPRIFLFERRVKPALSGQASYSVIEMELLRKLNAGEQEQVTRWVADVIGAKQRGDKPPPDPLRLGKGLSLLQTEATPRKVQLDIIKISNYLARDRLCGTRIVFSDPFD
jgi:hypothetical protein